MRMPHAPWSSSPLQSYVEEDLAAVSEVLKDRFAKLLAVPMAQLHCLCLGLGDMPALVVHRSGWTNGSK